MYRMFTGRFANQGVPKPGAEGARKLPAPSQINPKIPKELSDLVSQCLELSPERRPPGMFETHQQLVRIAKKMGLHPEDLKGADDDDEF